MRLLTGDLPISERIGDRLQRLPFFNDFSEKNQYKVIELITSFKCNLKKSNNNSKTHIIIL